MYKTWKMINDQGLHNFIFYYFYSILRVIFQIFLCLHWEYKSEIKKPYLKTLKFSCDVLVMESCHRFLAINHDIFLEQINSSCSNSVRHVYGVLIISLIFLIITFLL